MKSVSRTLIGLIVLLGVGIILFQPSSPNEPASFSRGQANIQSTNNNNTAQPTSDISVSQAVTPGISPAIRDLPVSSTEYILNDEIINPRHNPLLLQGSPGQPENIQDAIDPLIQTPDRNPAATPGIDLSFDGISATGSVPPDTVGEVGPNHYVQMVNAVYAIYNKSGALLAGPTDINQLWSGQGDACEDNNNGDPIVLYDEIADRWLLSQFALPNPYYLCIAISQTADPTGAYYLYAFEVPEFPDYPKFGVWPDAYYAGTNESSYAAYAFDRVNMLAGNAASFVRASGQSNFLMPADLDGSTQPPANSPGYFYTFKDNSFHGGSDRIEIFEFDVDWNSPGSSTFTLADTLPLSSFTYTVCGFFVLDCIPQPSTSEGLDPVGEWPMWRLQYRNFNTHEMMVGNFVVDVGSDRAGIRWFELRKDGGSWGIHQESTHAPADGVHRWMSSIAMDIAGNIALGYSASSGSLFPSIRYATRNVSDSLNTLQTEATLIAGGGSQTTNFNRWGDYSSLNVDPDDDCTFWYTNEYYSSTSIASWRTRIGTFKMPNCGITYTDFLYLPLIFNE